MQIRQLKNRILLFLSVFILTVCSIIFSIKPSYTQASQTSDFYNITKCVQENKKCLALNQAKLKIKSAAVKAANLEYTKLKITIYAEFNDSIFNGMRNLKIDENLIKSEDVQNIFKYWYYDTINKNNDKRWGWFAINVLLQLYFIIVIFIIWLFNSKNQNASKNKFNFIESGAVVLEDGQLFFYSVTICIQTIDELRNIKNALESNLLFYSTSFIILICSIVYGAIILGKMNNYGQNNSKTVNMKIAGTSLCISIVVTVYIMYIRTIGGLFNVGL